ncbi:histidine phosphatase superfamily [Daldinia loculata]|uniref:histidine phosphatase superfamily n=1 Tax=Daldinia loculata TaxID=103429 RepID=UPI0020C5A34D|nr:histidine phosphatase superfamily [Daldinia loculata]KAI1644134.1 histidine phosphatase superfamily [Daldinia loculata]KAI2773700.1 histidine phosphatase superfamily [Daldinia loculata]
MSVTIHIVRHAQGPHNVSHDALMMRDPFLTAEGLQQCARVQQTFPFTIDAIISSPQRRAIQTALICFGQFVAGGIQVDLHADLQETGSIPCNVGVDVPTLEKEFGGTINTDNLDDNWHRTGLYSDPTQLRARAMRVRRDIREYAVSMLEGIKNQPRNQDMHLAVVSHSIFIPFLTGDFSGGVNYFRNAEWRSYTFRDLRGTDENAALVETDQSLLRRRGTRPSASQNAAGQASISTHVRNEGRQGPNLSTPTPKVL